MPVLEEREINIDQLWASALFKYEAWQEAKSKAHTRLLDTLTSVGVSERGSNYTSKGSRFEDEDIKMHLFLLCN